MNRDNDGISVQAVEIGNSLYRNTATVQDVGTTLAELQKYQQSY